MGIVAALLLALALAMVWSGEAGAAELSPVSTPAWLTDGPVLAVLPVGDRVYIGGSFTYVGPLTGSGAPLSRATGLPLAGFAMVGESVEAAVPDGSGGYYIGGDFRNVGGVARSGLAHLRADGSLDRTWSPPYVAYHDPSFGDNGPGRIYALAVSRSTVYVGGQFTWIGHRSRHGLAAVDRRTGALQGWNPAPKGDTVVQALAVRGGTVYVGGAFGRIGGQRRGGLAAVDARTGAVKAWNPVTDGVVQAFAVSGSRVYAGGYFTRIGGRARNDIAAIGARTGAVLPWNPRTKGPARAVRAIAVSGKTVYVGGEFTSIGGRKRANIAALSARTGRATNWNPSARGEPAWEDDFVSALAVSGSTVYAGGHFTVIGGAERINIAALSARTGTATVWQPGASRTVFALAVSGSTVYAGGGFDSIGGLQRHNVAALDAGTGVATSWNPDANRTVYALASQGGSIYMGGDFTRIGDQPRNHLAAVSVDSGAAGAWNPNANAPVHVLAMSSSGVYAGGVFDKVGDQARTDIAELDPGAGNPTAWNPGANGDVDALTVSGSLVYAGGAFTRIGGQPRARIAALDTGTGLATGWDPSATCDSEDELGDRGCSDGGDTVVAPRVSAVAVSGSSIYVGGAFENIGGTARTNIAAIDAASGIATAWHPVGDYGGPGDYGPGRWVSALALSGSTIYIGGSDSDLAGFATSTGQPAWVPNGMFRALALTVSDSRLYVGGDDIPVNTPFNPVPINGHFAVFGPLTASR